MNLSKSVFFAAAAALIISAGNVARADSFANGTYTFYSTDGNTALDGSWVTYSGGSITNWDLVDSSINSSDSYNPNYPTYFPPLTPGNSAVIADPYVFTGPGNDFSFEIGSPDAYLSSTQNTDFYFEGGNYGPGAGYLYDGSGPGYTPYDPSGNWNYTASSAPDVAGTFELLFGALIALAACKSFLRRRVEARS